MGARDFEKKSLTGLAAADLDGKQTDPDAALEFCVFLHSPKPV